MFGRNVPIKPVYEPRDKLNIIGAWRTIQGEGPLAGQPAIFVRLAGCNLRCHFCDTEFTKGAHEIEVAALVEEVWSLIKEHEIHLVVLTGGEPLAQPIVPFVRALAASGLHVQIETAGTVWQDGLEELIAADSCTVVCSPKTAVVHPRIAQFAAHFKYIITAGEVSGKDGLPIYSTQEPFKYTHIWRPNSADVGPDAATIWVQPCDTGRIGPNRKNIEECVDVAMRHGHRISFQTHKALGVE